MKVYSDFVIDRKVIYELTEYTEHDNMGIGNPDSGNIRILAQKAADEILEISWKDQRFPVDPFVIARALDIRVKKIDVDSNVAGGIWAKKGYPPVVFLNSKDHPNRQRFTCAHELGHFYLRQGDDEFEFMDYRDSVSATGTDPVEVFANNFAACLLMPEEKVMELAKQGFTTIRMADFFGVSHEAMGWRLENLKLG